MPVKTVEVIANRYVSNVSYISRSFASYLGQVIVVIIVVVVVVGYGNFQFWTQSPDTRHFLHVSYDVEHVFVLRICLDHFRDELLRKIPTPLKFVSLYIARFIVMFGVRSRVRVPRMGGNFQCGPSRVSLFLSIFLFPYRSPWFVYCNSLVSTFRFRLYVCTRQSIPVVPTTNDKCTVDRVNARVVADFVTPEHKVVTRPAFVLGWTHSWKKLLDHNFWKFLFIYYSISTRYRAFISRGMGIAL